MNFGSATAWVAAMSAASYQGHSNWQLPTTPMTDHMCVGKPGSMGNSFGLGCDANALGYLYHKALGLKAPRKPFNSSGITTRQHGPESSSMSGAGK